MENIIKEIILEAKKKQGLSNYEIAKRAGLYQSQVDRYLYHGKDIGTVPASKILLALNIKIKWNF